ncbi:glutathione S-transferase parA [Pyrus ussuriensis x Pyrus communis]|uniref:Glutathione S-transferase parA n=1 Tax=Pyrus ussuriensis x Pyrus communis TaxID=2448454 RepID=A0A5N5G1L6_9ROSA|nr:glutathione S-transferase parA [Pyrus ussuriensis x Pyrus communis]
MRVKIALAEKGVHYLYLEEEHLLQKNKILVLIHNDIGVTQSDSGDQPQHTFLRTCKCSSKQ